MLVGGAMPSLDAGKHDRERGQIAYLFVIAKIRSNDAKSLSWMLALMWPDSSSGYSALQDRKLHGQEAKSFARPHTHETQFDLVPRPQTQDPKTLVLNLQVDGNKDPTSRERLRAVSSELSCLPRHCRVLQTSNSVWPSSFATSQPACTHTLKVRQKN